MPEPGQFAPTRLDDPSPRRSFWRMASKIILAHLVFILAILIPLGIHENRQAQRDWDDFKAHWEAKGEIFDLEKLIPPEIPDEENFAAAPIIADIFSHPDDNLLDSIDLDNLPGFGEHIRSINDTQRALGAFGDKLSNYLDKPDDYPTDKEAALIILKALEPLKPIFAEFEQACQRPKVRYPLDYSSPFTMTRPHLRALLNIIKPLTLRARAHIILGNSADAQKDLTTLFYVIDSMKSDESLISTVMIQAYLGTILPTIWELLYTNLTDSNDLNLIGNALLKIELKQRLLMAIRVERAGMLALIENKSESIFEDMGSFGGHDYLSPKTLAKTYQLLGMSRSLILRNKLNYCQFYQSPFLSTLNNNNIHWADLETASEAQKRLDNLSKHTLLPYHPHTIFLQTLGISLHSIAERTAQIATRIDLARIAIALELYRREHGNYPTTLAHLAPNYLTPIPNDLITGDPLHYRIKADGTPIIYSIGLNKTDDGGLLKQDHSQGDWVWQYTLPDDFNEADWRK